ncbi:unnamed protein product [Lota lota]
MESKKKPFFFKFPHLKKVGKKTRIKQGKKLAYRRSLSVPDLRTLPEGASLASPADPSFFNSPSPSDNDSIASGNIQRERPPSGRASSDVPPAVRYPLSRDHVDNRISAPVESWNHLDDKDAIRQRLNSEGKWSFHGDPGRVPKASVMEKAPFQSALPVPMPRSVSSNQLLLLPRLAAPGERESWDRSESPSPNRAAGTSDALSSALSRASSFGEQARGRLSPSSVLRPPSQAERWALPLDGFSDDERSAVAWNTDSEDQDRELMSQYFSKLDEDPAEEEEEEEEEEETAADPEETGPSGSATSSVQSQRYLLNINLKEGRNLAIKNRRSATSDPYVKFKMEGKQFYRSKVVYKSLSPHWNESFSHPVRDKDPDIEARVYDKNLTSDEFMGSAMISISHLELYKNYEVELRLDDPKSKDDNLGSIIVDLCLMYRDATIKRSPGAQQTQGQTGGQSQGSLLKNQVWTGVYSITLVEGLDLPPHGPADLYVRFRLADQKYKSKNLCIQANPQWRERFDFNQFEDNQEPLQVEVFSKRGRKSQESWGMLEVDLSLVEENQRQLYTHVLNPGKGRLVFLVTLTPCWGVSVGDILAAPLQQYDERKTIQDRLSLLNSHKSLREVGFLQVKVLKATDLPADINGKNNPFCLIELGNSRLQTQTILKTLNPEWNKVFTFPVKDIHDVVELTVLDDNGDKTPTVLGKVAMPLLSVQNGQRICRLLKKESLGTTAKGSITLELDVIYNQIRAGVRTFQPKETRFTEENLKFSKKALAQNIYRVRKITTAVLYTLQYIKSCFQWENRQRSLIAFLIFLLTVWHLEVYMLPLFLLLLIGWNYYHLRPGRVSSNQDLVNMNMTDDEEEDDKDSRRKGLMDKIHMVQEVVLTMQNILDEIASIGERVKNTFNWTVPFCSWLACLALLLATALAYFIPLRYIVLAWGVNKFTKKLRSPHAIDNNEILEFLKRVPSDVQKVQYSEQSPAGALNPARKKR